MKLQSSLIISHFELTFWLSEDALSSSHLPPFITEPNYPSRRTTLLILGNIYFIGGQTNHHFPQIASRTVTRLRISNGSLERVQSMPSAACQPAVATSPGFIAACGGALSGAPVPKCQIFSLNGERWVCSLCMAGGRTVHIWLKFWRRNPSYIVHAKYRAHRQAYGN